MAKKLSQMTEAEMVAAYKAHIARQERYQAGGGKITSLRPQLTETQQLRFDDITRQLAALSQQRVLMKKKLERINQLTEKLAKERLELQRVSLVSYNPDEEMEV